MTEKEFSSSSFSVLFLIKLGPQIQIKVLAFGHYRFPFIQAKDLLLL